MDADRMNEVPGLVGTPVQWVTLNTKVGAASRQPDLECEPSPDPFTRSSLTDRWFEVVDAIAKDRGISRQAAVLILAGLFEDYQAAAGRIDDFCLGSDRGANGRRRANGG